ncbi:MAG: hypothetical protein AAF658_21390, partial [Myxococcota bacterium]
EDDPRIEIVSFPVDTNDTAGPYRVEVVPTPNDPDEIARLELEVTFLPSVSQVDLDFARDGARWFAEIGGRPAGTEIEFRVALTDSSGTIVRAPADGPLSFQITQ